MKEWNRNFRGVVDRRRIVARPAENPDRIGRAASREGSGKHPSLRSWRADDASPAPVPRSYRPPE